MIVISGCDKTGAAALMPLARTNAFGLVLYPGTSTPGRVSFGAWAGKGNNLTIMDYAEARAANESGRISGEELLEVERNVMPGSGTCGAMFTANTMSTIAEAIGMMLPRGASHPGRLRCRQRHPCRRPRAGARLGRRAVPADGGRHPAARHHDRARLRERDHDGLRDGRLDQHVPASAGGRARGPGADHDRTHPADRRAGPAARQPAAARPVRDGQPACDRRRAGRDEGAAARRPAAWRRHDGDRQDAGGKSRRRSDAGPDRAGRRSSSRCRSRSRRRTTTSAC